MCEPSAESLLAKGKEAIYEERVARKWGNLSVDCAVHCCAEPRLIDSDLVGRVAV